jgi:glutamate-1-semialdehyde 2,1-aminomutase
MERINVLVYKQSENAFHGGTFTGNPVTMTAGLATLRALEDGELINGLNGLGEKIREQIGKIFENSGIDVQVTGAGSIFNVHFTKEPVKDAIGSCRADKRKLFDYNLALIANGIFFLPTHNGALSTAHSDADIEKLYAETEKYAKQHEIT